MLYQVYPIFPLKGKEIFIWEAAANGQLMPADVNPGPKPGTLLTPEAVWYGSWRNPLGFGTCGAACPPEGVQEKAPL